jgi:multidrug transporter EmrE-like cation transporter
MNPITVFWILVAALVSAVPIALIKQWTKTENNNLLLLSVLCYLILIFALTNLLKDANIAILYPILKCLSILIVVVFGILFYEHKINNYTALGILLGLGSIMTLSMCKDAQY